MSYIRKNHDRCVDLKCNGSGAGTSEVEQWSTEQLYQEISELVGMQRRIGSSTSYGTLSFDDIKGYFQNGQVHRDKFEIRLLNVTYVELQNEPPTLDSCTWLWHGSKIGCLPSILKNGLMKPRNKHKGLAGDGIYFADRASKSAQYCFDKNVKNGYRSFLLLCKVSTGLSHVLVKPDKALIRPPAGKDSVLCKGAYIPDSRFSKLVDGCWLPMGSTVRNQSNICMTAEDKYLKYNEYVLYDVSRIQVRYLVEIEFFNVK